MEGSLPSSVALEGELFQFLLELGRDIVVIEPIFDRIAMRSEGMEFVGILIARP